MLDETSPFPTTPSEAYQQALAGADFLGRELLPWSPARSVAANAMGLGYPLPPDAVEQLRTRGFYAGAMRDLIIHAWIRTVPNASEQTPEQIKAREWTVQRATRTPHEAWEAALAWGEVHGLTDLDSEASAQAYRLMLSTLIGVALSEFEPVPAEKTPADRTPTPDPNA